MPQGVCPTSRMSSLYLNHFDLAKPPFQITPDVDFFFSGSQRGGILTGLLHVASHEEGIVTVVAEVGSGKTLLSRLMLASLPADISTVYLSNPCFGRDEIISAIGRDMGLTTQVGSTEANLAQLHQELMRRYSLGKRVLLIIDEAHTMPPESLEEVRLLSNLETAHHKLINIMLFGQPELDTLLADRRLRQVRDRVIHRFELPAMVAGEAQAYVDHRLRVAGWRGGQLLDSAAMKALIKLSQGRARRINLLADKALLAAYAQGAKVVTRAHVLSAQRELHAEPAALPGRNKWLLGAVAGSFAIAIAGAIGWGLNASKSVTAVAEVRSSVSVPAVVSPAIASPAAVAPVVAPSLPPEMPALKPAAAVAKVALLPAPSVPILTGTSLQGAEIAGKGQVFDRAALDARTHEMMRDEARTGFTLQLVSLPSMEALAGYAASLAPHIDTRTLYAHKRRYRGVDSAAVYVGYYSTDAEARAALAQLPTALRAYQPSIRTWAAIRREPAP